MNVLLHIDKNTLQQCPEVWKCGFYKRKSLESDHPITAQCPAGRSMDQFDMICDRQMGAATVTRCALAWKGKIIALLYAVCGSCLSNLKLLHRQLHAERRTAAKCGCNEYKMRLTTCPLKLFICTQDSGLVACPRMQEKYCLQVVIKGLINT